MRSGRVRALVAGILIGIMAFSGVAFGGQTEVQKLQAQIRDLQSEVKKAGDAYSAAYWALDKTRVEMAAVDEQLKAQEAALAEARAELGNRAADMYRTGGTQYLAILFSSDDLNDIVMRLEYMQRLNQDDADVINQIKVLQEDLAKKRAELEALQATQAQEAAKLKADAEKIEAQLKAQQAEYNALQKKLAAAIAAEKARTGRTTAKAGPNGMVFPVQGPCYYRDTWGDARSGGRTHKGTDIMAAEGTPLVAVLSGTVRSKYSTLGGKTIWLTANNGWAFYYAHLSSYKVTSGRVTAGQVIGYVGHTGNATASAPHLHFEIHPNGGSAVNPYPYLKQMQ